MCGAGFVCRERALGQSWDSGFGCFGAVIWSCHHLFTPNYGFWS